MQANDLAVLTTIGPWVITLISLAFTWKISSERNSLKLDISKDVRQEIGTQIENFRREVEKLRLEIGSQVEHLRREAERSRAEFAPREVTEVRITSNERRLDAVDRFHSEVLPMKIHAVRNDLHIAIKQIEERIHGIEDAIHEVEIKVHGKMGHT